MAAESSIVLSSGLASKRDEMFATLANAKGQVAMRGTSVVVLNPEDASAWALRSLVVTVASGTITPIPGNPYEYRRAVALHNMDAAETLYIGDSSVSTSTGFPVAADSSISLDLIAKGIIYGIADADIEVRVLEVK